MIIKQRFNRGSEQNDGVQFFDAIPDDPVLLEAVEAVLEVIANNVTYKEYFVLEIDTQVGSADVVEAV